MTRSQAALPSLYACSAAVAQDLHTAYHLMLEREQLRTSLLCTSLALSERQGSVQVWEAWTDVGNIGVVRRSDLRKSDNLSQITVPDGR